MGSLWWSCVCLALGSGCRWVAGVWQGHSLGAWVMGQGPGWSLGLRARLGGLRPLTPLPTPLSPPPPHPARCVCLLPPFRLWLRGGGMASLWGGGPLSPWDPAARPPHPLLGCPHPRLVAVELLHIIHGGAAPLCGEGGWTGEPCSAQGLGRPRLARRNGWRGQQHLGAVCGQGDDPYVGSGVLGVQTEHSHSSCSTSAPSRGLGGHQLWDPHLAFGSAFGGTGRQEPPGPEGCDGGQLNLCQVHLRLSSTCPHVQYPCGQTDGGEAGRPFHQGPVPPPPASPPCQPGWTSGQKSSL